MKLHCDSVEPIRYGTLAIAEVNGDTITITTSMKTVKFNLPCKTVIDEEIETISHKLKELRAQRNEVASATRFQWRAAHLKSELNRINDSIERYELKLANLQLEKNQGQTVFAL